MLLDLAFSFGNECEIPPVTQGTRGYPDRE
jgi:hypothetical protein